MYFNGALSLQPEGLRPITSLSTLDQHGYPYPPKTRYQVRWVPASWAALAAASKTAPRGAQEMISGGNRCRLYVLMGRFYPLWPVNLAIPNCLAEMQTAIEDTLAG